MNKYLKVALRAAGRAVQGAQAVAGQLLHIGVTAVDLVKAELSLRWQKLLLNKSAAAARRAKEQGGREGVDATDDMDREATYGFPHRSARDLDPDRHATMLPPKMNGKPHLHAVAAPLTADKKPPPPRRNGGGSGNTGRNGGGSRSN